MQPPDSPRERLARALYECHMSRITVPESEWLPWSWVRLRVPAWLLRADRIIAGLTPEERSYV